MSQSDLEYPHRSWKYLGEEQGYAVAYRQWRADSHCNQMHGYSLRFKVTFEASALDHRNWVVDFGSLKSFKENLKDWFDHTTLVAQDDPDLPRFQQMHADHLIKMVVFKHLGCEAIARFLFDYLETDWLPNNGYAPRVRMHSVEVIEHQGNGALFVRTPNYVPDDY